MEDQECKCYNVLSTKTLLHKGQIFDILAAFLKKEKESQLHHHYPSSLTTEEGDEEGDHDQHHHQQLDRDLIREKAVWNELRQWANELMEGDECISSKKRARKTIEAWKAQQERPDDKNRSYLKGEEPADDARSDRSFPHSTIQTDSVDEDNRLISKGLIKVETMESTGRAEVSIVGRSAAASFVDHVESDLDDIEDTKHKKIDSKEAKRARKKEKKQAKKAKKEAKKKVKEESKKRKHREVAVKMEE
jgi:hypothetical protein